MKKLPVAVCILAMNSQCGYAKTVSSLSEVRGEIKSKEIRTMYDEQMDGIAKKDGFGSLARNDSRVTSLLSLIGHETDIAHLGLVSLKPWQNNQYIAIACSHETPTKLYTSQPSERFDSCENFLNPLTAITVALVTKNAQGQWQLVAKPYHENPKALTHETRSTSAFALLNPAENMEVGNLDRLDLANYQLNDTTKAFGIRYSVDTGYAGGGASSQAMNLFAVIAGRLKPVLSVATYEYENIAGEWHNDGTRDHDITTSEYILKILPQQKNGFYNILWQEKSVKKPEQRIYTWNNQKQHYE